MSDDTINKVLESIKRDFKFKDVKSDWLRKGKCPDCQKESVFVAVAKPWVLHCERTNKCGASFSVRDLYPEIFQSYSNRYEQTKENPNAAADAYLKDRGLDISTFQGWYTQELYEDKTRKLTSATVRFWLPNGGYWQRLIDFPDKFDGKAKFNFGVEYKGTWWQPKDLTLEDLAKSEAIWLTEGIFNTLSLRQVGLTSVSIMSSNNYPSKYLAELKEKIAELGLEKKPKLIWALDSGKAGEDATVKFVEWARATGWVCEAAFPVPETSRADDDWNDHLKANRLTPDDLEKYLWNGRLFFAQNALEKAMLYYERDKIASFALTFEKRTYWAGFDEAAIAKMIEESKVTRRAAIKATAEINKIADCAFEFLYFQRNVETDESYYYIKISIPGRKDEVNAAFTGSQISKGTEFKTRLLNVAGGSQYFGSTQQLEKIISSRATYMHTVESLDYIGYSKKYEAWFFGDHAVHRGKVIKRNDQDYFNIGKHFVKLSENKDNPTLKCEYKDGDLQAPWLDDFWVANRGKGVAALAFWVMSYFAEQIRLKHKSLAFLEISGIPGSGKSTLLQFLWKLSGRAWREEYEGVDPAKATSASLGRNFNRISNLPVVLLEGDRTIDVPHSKKFDWNELKNLYNSGTFRPRAIKSGGNETYEPPFKGTVVIAQNHPVQTDDTAIPERIMPIVYDKSGWSALTKKSADLIETWPQEEVSGTVIHVVKNEKIWVEKFFENMPKYEARFLTDACFIKNQRVRKNHAQLHAALDATALIFPLSKEQIHETHEFIDQMAVNRESSLQGDHPIVAKFWEMYEALEAKCSGDTELISEARVNLSRKPDQFIAINFPHFEERARKNLLTPDSSDILKKYLRDSRSRKFVDTKTVNCSNGRTLHCWVFAQPKERITPDDY